jgi:uncharacterized lipoprotein YbaY
MIDIAGELNSLVPAAFTPDLTLVDGLVQSIQTPAVAAEMPKPQEVPAVSPPAPPVTTTVEVTTTTPATPTTPALSGVLTGTVAYLQRSALPPEAVIQVQLLDVSKADAPATLIASQTIEAKGQQAPIPFALTYDPAAIDPKNLYTVAASIKVGGELQWISTTVYPVLTRGNPMTGIEILVDPLP